MRVPGLWYEEFEVGQRIVHGRVEATQDANAAFCALTHNNQPLHLDAQAARAAGFKDTLVNGLWTFATAVGVSVPDTTEGTLIANMGYEDVAHPAPVHPGDVLETRTHVTAKRPSSRPGRGLVTLEHTVHNQEDTLVCRFKRTVLVRCRPEAS